MMTIQLPGIREPLPIQSIVWLEGDANYTKVHCQNGKSELITHSLIWFERQLNFIRIHRSTIVNPNYMVGFRQKRSRAGWVQLTDGLVLPVSRSRLEHTAASLRLSGYAELVAESAYIKSLA